MIREVLQKHIREAFNNLSLEVPEVIGLEHPADMGHGDYSSNVAMILAKQEGKNPQESNRTGASPRELAEQIVKDVRHRMSNIPEIEDVQVAGPGFINFYLSREFFSGSVGDVLSKNEGFGKGKKLKGVKAIYEYTDPNPFKAFHIGHLMSNTVGEALSRIGEWSGADVKRVCYQGDVGMHVASSVWGLQSMGYSATSDFSSVTAETLGQAYARGATAAKENAEAKEEIVALNKKIYERNDPSINDLYDKGKKLSLEYFETLYTKLGTDFDNYFFESETGKIGKELVEENMNTVFEESDGAVVFPGEKYDLHTRVFLNSEGLPTYEAKELGLAKMKHDWYAYDRSTIITGNEIDEYFKVLLKAMEFVYPDLVSKTAHVSHGMLHLPSGKMSSRTGDVVTAEAMIDEAKTKVLERMHDRDVADKEQIAEMIAIGALKYSILKQAPGKDVIFDFDKSLSFEGDSGPYLQYTYVRTRSLLEKAEKEGMSTPSVDIGEVPEEVTKVEKLLYRFPEIIEYALSEYAPQHIVHFLTELAGAFNTFYGAGKIVDPNDPESPYKLALTQGVDIVLKNGLTVLGIKAPQSM